MLLVVGQKMRAVEADAPEDFLDVVDQVTVVHGLGESNVAKVTGTVDLGAHACLAESVLVHGTEEVVVDAVGDGVSIFFVGCVFVNARDRLLNYFFTA
jgi:hypothetical protein